MSYICYIALIAHKHLLIWHVSKQMHRCDFKVSFLMMMVMNQLTNQLQETPGEQCKPSFCKIRKRGDKNHFCELLWKNKEIFSLFKPSCQTAPVRNSLQCSVVIKVGGGARPHRTGPPQHKWMPFGSFMFSLFEFWLNEFSFLLVI